MHYIFVPFTLIVIFVICLLFLNLFVGVVIETFNTQKEVLTNNHVLTPVQRTYLMTQLLTFTVRPKVYLEADETNRMRFWAQKIVSHSKFEPFILGVIVLNTTVLASNHFGMTPSFE